MSVEIRTSKTCEADRSAYGGAVAVIAKTALISGLLVGIGWVSFNVRIEGRTPYGHFRSAGGERAVLEGWAWLRDGVTSGAHTAWEGTKSTASSGVDAMGGWLENASNAAKRGWTAVSEGGGEAGGGAAPAPQAPPPRRAESSGRPAAPRVPAIQTDSGARARVQRLEQAARTAAVSAAPTAERTRIDRRIAPEEKAALDDKLAARGAR